MVAPASVNFVANVLIANIRRQTHPVQGVFVVGRRVNHVGAVNHQVTRFVIGDQPARTGFVRQRRQVFGKPTLFHVSVVGADLLFGSQALVAFAEVRLEPVKYWFERFKSVVWSQARADAEHSLVRLCRLQQVIADAFLYKHNQEPDLRNTPWLSEAKRHLEAIDTQTDHREVARQLGMFYEGFRKRFKRETGLSPGQYYQQVRMREASKLLIEKSLSIKEIAERLHFYDEFHFSKQFKKALVLHQRSIDGRQ